MLILGLDFETTGLDPETDRIIEIGAVLWDTDKRSPALIVSDLVWDASYPPISKEITGITGINQLDLDSYAIAPAAGVERLNRAINQAAVIVAHNGLKFDRPFYYAELRRQKYEQHTKWFDVPWVDTSVDVPYPDRVQTRKLTHLAAEHGFVNPFAHRALFDVLTMLTVLNNYKITEVLDIASQPSVELVALTQPPWKDQGQSTGLAKARGYRWDGARKVWSKVVKQSQVEKERTHGEFPVTVIENAG